MAWLCSSAIDRTPWSNCGNASPRDRVGLLASSAVHDRRNASIRDRLSLFALLLMAWSMVITLVVMRARGSVIPAMLFHASANICAFTIWEPDSPLLGLGPWIVAAVIAGWRMQSELSHSSLTGDVL